MSVADIVVETENTDEHETTGGRIATAREAQGLSPAQLARRLGIKTTTLIHWENDQSEPRANRLMTLAGVLNVTPTWLLTGRGEGPSGDFAKDELELLRAELSRVRDLQNQLAAGLDRIEDRMRKITRHFLTD